MGWLICMRNGSKSKRSRCDTERASTCDNGILVLLLCILDLTVTHF